MDCHGNKVKNGAIKIGVSDMKMILLALLGAKTA